MKKTVSKKGNRIDEKSLAIARECIRCMTDGDRETATLITRIYRLDEPILREAVKREADDSFIRANLELLRLKVPR